MKPPFYHNTIRKIVVAFGTLFNELSINREDSNGIYQEIPVPISYMTKEKFIARINNIQQPGDETITIEETLPKMSFEMTGMIYDSSRKENTIQKMRSEVDDDLFMFQRVPYNIDFTLNIATRKIDDSLRIVEQIVPYFTPELTLKIIDMEALQINTNIPITLADANYEIDSQGVFDDRRTVFWSLNFTAQAYLYANYRDNSVIRKAEINMRDLESGVFYERVIAELDPINANSWDDVVDVKITIDDQEDNPPLIKGGERGEVDLI